MNLAFVLLLVALGPGDLNDLMREPLDKKIPRLEAVAGFDFGENVTSHAEALAYARLLAESSPNVQIQEVGRSWEGRVMPLLIVSSRQHIDDLDAIQRSYRELADPRAGDESTLQARIARLPVCIWLAESVHGNETSGTDSGLALAYYLAASSSEEAQRIREDAIVLVFLMQNPDGRDRFVSYYRRTKGPAPDSDRQAAQHREPWPSGRPNHYLFDLNRDWFALTQVETQVKVRTFLDWYPQVAVDIHEMGTDESFFVATPAPPVNPVLPQSMLDMYGSFGHAIAKQFDARGIDYFHSEIFDSFYPGYGESWPSLQGSVGMLFEQARALGIIIDRRDGRTLSHREAVRNQLLASLAVCNFAIGHRTQLLEFFQLYRKESWLEGKELDTRQVFLLPGEDPLRAFELARLLQMQGIEVRRVTEEVKGLSVKTYDGRQDNKREIPPGAFVVRFNQPAGRLARSLLMPDLKMDDAFVEEQDRRFKERLGDQIYDVTSWSLPLIQGVPALLSGSGWKGEGAPLEGASVQVPTEPASLGYLIPYGRGAMRALYDMQDQGMSVSFTTKQIDHQGVVFPSGSLILRNRDHREDLLPGLTALARKHGFSFFGTDHAWFDAGPSLGSGEVLPVAESRVALVWGEPGSSLSVGWLRFTLEQLLRRPVTLLRSDEIGSSLLLDYDVLFLPGTSAAEWNDCFGASGRDKIKAWVRSGGVLVAVGDSLDWLIDDKVDLLSSAREYRGGRINGPEAQQLPEHPEKPIVDPESLVEPVLEYPRRVRGGIIRVLFDTDHWLAFGMQGEQPVMVDSNRIYRPLRLNRGRNVGRYAGENPALSGFVPEATAEQLKYKAFVMVQAQGLGRVIAIAEEPVYRGMGTGCLPLVANAVYFAPSVVKQRYE